MRCLGLIFLAILTGCTTINPGKEAETKEPPKLTAEMSAKELVRLGIEFGGPTLESAKTILSKSKRDAEAHSLAEKAIVQSVDQMSLAELLNAANLYQATGKSLSLKVVERLLASDSLAVRQVGWELASRNPNRDIARYLEDYLSKLIVNAQEHQALVPEMARAVSANQIKSVYTLLREGLMVNGADDFAKAMSTLNPDLASHDFITYLARAPVEDLRQLTQQSVNVYTCMVIFRHFLSVNSFPLDHPNIDHVFLYAVSRNHGLAEMAETVIERFVPNHRDELAFALARLPVWIQIAYVEGNRQNPNPNVGIFLGELKKVTAHQEVVEEISGIVR